MDIGSPSPQKLGQHGWFHAHSATLVDRFRFLDAAWILLGAWLGFHQQGVHWGVQHSVACATAVILFAFFTRLWPLYRSWRSSPLGRELGLAALCWITAIALVGVASYLIAPDNHELAMLLPSWAAITLGGQLGTRLALRLLLRAVRARGRNYRVTAIAGANAVGARLARSITQNSWMGLKFAGFYDDRADAADRRERDLDVKGGFDDLIAAAADGSIDIVYITLPLRSELRIRELIERLRNSATSVYFVPDFSAIGLLRPSMDSLDGQPVVNLIDTPHHGIDAASKRLFDLIVGSIAMLLLALPMIGIALAIKLTSPGPVIFRQRRYGLGGREFEIWKFRTMTVCEDGNGVFTQARKGDSRVTPLGAFLRRTSLDELPQLFQVLKGSMSIVGPRPHPIALNEAQRKLIEGYMLRHKVKPGITGWAQINGYRGETDTPEKMLGRIRYDLEYIQNWSLMLDVRILLGTFVSIVNDPNAY